MLASQLLFEDLVLASRSLALEEKQELLKRLDTLPEDKKTKLRAILEHEFDTFVRLDALAFEAVSEFAQSLQTVPVTA